jgi:hypothetical protein
MNKLSIKNSDVAVWDDVYNRMLPDSLRADSFYLNNYVVDHVYLCSLARVPFYGSTTGLEVVVPYTRPVYDDITGTRLYAEEEDENALQSVAHRVTVPTFVLFFRQLLLDCSCR